MVLGAAEFDDLRSHDFADPLGLAEVAKDLSGPGEETCPSDSQRFTSFVDGLSVDAADENQGVAKAGICLTGDHLSTFNNQWDTSDLRNKDAGKKIGKKATHHR